MNESMLQIPLSLFNTLMESYYFKEACFHCGIEEWHKYADIKSTMSKMSMGDIQKFYNISVDTIVQDNSQPFCEACNE